MQSQRGCHLGDGGVGGRTLLWVISCLVLSEKARKGQREKRNGPQSKQSKQAYVYFGLASLLFSACMRNIATTSVDQLTAALVAERLCIRKIRMEISTSNQYITLPMNPPTRPVRPFSSTANFTVSSNVLLPCNRATSSLWPPIFSTLRRYPSRTRESITLQPLNPPSIDDTTQIHDPRRLSLLEFNIQPTHSHPS